ncbi:MAG TPA: flagellar type III secretion system pore protein FliP [Burkholderiales bacterium]|nr:flagellar type III secretion system pore protein FliP [Burkholderiales bacterium]
MAKGCANARMARHLRWLLALTLAFAALPVFAEQAALPAFTSTPGPGGSQTYSLPIQTLLFLTTLTFLPALLLMMTGFTRIVIVLSLVRQAIGTPTSPPNQVLIGLALFLNFFVMAPTLDAIYKDAYQPFTQNKLNATQAMERASLPLRQFMMKQTRETDLGLFLKLSDTDAATPEQVPLKALIPAFVTSELKTAFQIGFLIFIPFLIIDMVVSSVLMSMGMMMLSPVMISLPFKIMLFVLADGWNLLIGSLVRSFSP